MIPHPSSVDRRRFLALMGLSAGAVVGTQALGSAAEAATWRLHDNTHLVGLSRLYSGSVNNNVPRCDTAASSDCPGPGLLSAYWGGLYVNSTTQHRLRTGRFTTCGARFPGTGLTDRCRWASTRLWRPQPEYRFSGQLYVDAISPNRPQPGTGLVFHPVHLSNCDNYFIRIWERDQPQLTFGKEINDVETVLLRAPFPTPALRIWHQYRIDVLPNSRFRFWWNGQLRLEATDPAQTFRNGGPVGMRLDYFDTILDETRVFVP
jgi:hypothetical protein